MKVTIIGAGISGLVMGILLQQKGIAVHLYEKRSSISPIGGGLGIKENPFRILMSLPCAQKILALSEKIDDNIHVDQDGKLLNKEPHNELNICRSDLIEVLLEQFGIHNITFNALCTGIDNKQNSITAHFANGQNEISDLLIAADGINSTIRNLQFSKQNLKYSGYLQLAGIIDDIEPEKITNNFIWGKNHFAISFPISQNRCLIYQAMPFPEEKFRKLQMNNIQEKINLFRGWSKLTDDMLDLYSRSLDKNNLHFYCGEAHHMNPLNKWHEQRCVLIGDAAHPMGSLLGLGASTAIENCQELAWQLTNQSNIDEALIAYEAKQKLQSQAYFQQEQDATRFLLNSIDEPSFKDTKPVLLKEKSTTGSLQSFTLFSSPQQKYKKIRSEVDINDEEMSKSVFANSHTARMLKASP